MDYLEYKRCLANFNISISDGGRDLGDSVFIGRGLGVFHNKTLICAFPFRSAEAKHQEGYHEAIRTLTKDIGHVKKLSLYQLNHSKEYFAVIGSNRSKYSLPKRLTCLSKNIKSDLSLNKTELKIYFEDVTSNITIGSIGGSRKMYGFHPVIAFNHKYLTNSVIQKIIPILSFIGKGTPVEGAWVLRDYTQERTLLVKKFPFSLSYNMDIQTIPYIHELNLNMRKRSRELNVNETYLLNNKLIKKTMLIGNPIDYDWFGQEHGFYLESMSGESFRFMPETLSNKAVVHVTNYE